MSSLNSEDYQGLFCRRVYIVELSDSLKKHLFSISRQDLVEYFEEPVVVMTKKVDFEMHLEGWQKVTINAAKKTYIMDNLVGDFCPFANDEEMHEILGNGSYIEIFDRWLHIKDVEYFEIEIDWKKDF